MYIGTNLTKKQSVDSVIDKIDFSFKISKYSIPYDTNYGIDYTNCADENILLFNISSGLSNLGIPNLRLESLNLSDRKIEAVIDYNGEKLSEELDI